MDLTNEEKEMIINAIDLSVATISRGIGQIAPEHKQEARLNISRFLNLQQKVESLKVGPLKPVKDV